MAPTLTFRLRGVQLLEDERAAVVGSSPNLGFWSPKATCYLKRTADGCHERYVTVEDSSIEYKYIILKSGKIRWEGGYNRVVHLAGEDLECDDIWVSRGASEYKTPAGRVEEVPADAAAEVGDNVPLEDDEPAEVEVDENTPQVGNVLPEAEPKEGAKNCEMDSRKEAFTSPDVRRSPFLLIDSIFRMWSRGTTNAN